MQFCLIIKCILDIRARLVSGMPRIARKKLQDVVKSLKSSKTFVGVFSHLDKFVVKAKSFSFLLVCKLNIVCFYVTRKTFEIFDPTGFLKTLKCLKNDILRKLVSFAQNKEIMCNTPTSDVCLSLFAAFITMRDAGYNLMRTIKKLL